MPKKKTQEQFEQEVYEILGPDYKVLGQYQGKDVKIEIIHYKCGNTFLKRPHDVTSKGSGCPYCNGNKAYLYKEPWVKENTPLPYHYINGYVNMSTKCLFHCDKCNSDFFQSPKRLINQHIYGCNCCKKKKKTHEQFLQELGEQTLQEYEMLEKYINIDTKIKIKHLKCGTIFEQTPWAFIHKFKKQYCPICYYKKSKGEVIINQFLEKNNIQYHKEFIFPNDNKRYDFFLPEENAIIEFDGEQHFRAIDFFGGEEGLKQTQHRDKEKNVFCIKNNILLYRIPYTDIDKINEILYKIFKEKSSTTIEKYLITE